jgi:plasmid stability protein
MRTITLKEIPDPLHAALKKRAAKNFRSLNREILCILQETCTAGESKRDGTGAPETTPIGLPVVNNPSLIAQYRHRPPPAPVIIPLFHSTEVRLEEFNIDAAIQDVRGTYSPATTRHITPPDIG